MKITLKDGSVKEYSEAKSVFEIAKDISEGLARMACAGEVNGEIVDLRTTIHEDADLNIVTANDKAGLTVIRHTAAHVMAEAVKRLFPSAKVTIGPAIEDGFYYDFDTEPFSREDLDKIEAEMKKIVKELLDTSIYLLVVLVLTYLVITFVGQRTQVSGSSMETTLSDEDNLIVDKISYRFSEPKRFDIIVFPFEYEEDTYYIKRIIGMPGERVQIDGEGNIYIDGEVLEESYGREIMESPGRAWEEITLAEDEYFVLGDNRNHSSDSRDPSVGNIKRKDIIGRAFLRIWPFEKFGILRHQ